MVRYFCEDTDFNFRRRRLNNAWFKTVCEKEGKRLGDVNVIFCSDEYLLGVNLKYLGHDYYTDIITFDYCESDTVSGDLFISIDSVRDNSEHYGVTFENELDRVMIHGILHLLGYDDHSDGEIAEMRGKEDESLLIKKNLQQNDVCGL